LQTPAEDDHDDEHEYDIFVLRDPGQKKIPLQKRDYFSA
jgi:hypothetical protein